MPIYHSTRDKLKRSFIDLQVNFSTLKEISITGGTSNRSFLKISTIVLALFVFTAFSSCNVSKNQVYFQDLPNDTTLRNVINENYDPKIRKGDLLGITVASLSPDVAFFNSVQTQGKEPSGYLVDQNGNIDFVKLGILH